MAHEPDPLQASTESQPADSKPALRRGGDPQLALPFAAMAEALRANVCWSTLDEAASLLLSSAQVDRFRQGGEVESEHRVLGRRGAFFVRHDVGLAAGEEREWSIVADLGYGASDVARLQALLSDGDRRRVELRDDLDAWIHSGLRQVGSDYLDGLAASLDEVE